MAFTAKDGKSFGNRQKMKAYDERTSEKPEAKEPENEGQDASDQDINEVVAQHGPADKIEIEHDHVAGHHKVTSHHGGHKHHSEHGTAEEAHMHAAQAAGVNDEAQETPQFEAGEQEGAKEYAGIPGM